MPKAFETWQVLGHAPIDKVTDHLWMVRGKLPKMNLQRWMCVARMSDGRLVVHNAIALEEDAMKELEAWGTPAFIVVPNGWHRLDCAVFKRRYPEAKVMCPEGSRKKVEEVVQVDLTYDEFPDDDVVSFEHVEGIAKAEGVMTVRSGDGDTTLVFNDLLFNVPHQSGFSGFVFRMLGSTGGPKVTRIFRMFAVKDKKAVRANLERLGATENLVRVVPGHGYVVTEEPGAVLGQVASQL